MVTTKKVSKVEIRIKVKAFVITRIKKFVDIVISPFFKKIIEVNNQKRTNIKRDEKPEGGQHNKNGRQKETSTIKLNNVFLFI